MGKQCKIRGLMRCARKAICNQPEQSREADLAVVRRTKGQDRMLEFKNVSYVVSDDLGTKEIIRDVNLKINENEFVAITGPNGGGKSTLAKLMMGILIPTSGQILYKGQDITEMSITERAKLGMGFAFQQPVRFKGIKVKDLITLAAGENTSTANACEYLSEVGLCARDYINREVNASLSGGELKRIEIATIIAKKPDLSIFDEPEAGIDLWSFTNLIRVFERMHKEINGAIVIISHQERILNTADRIIVLADGKVVNEGKKDKILPGLLSSSEMACRYYNADAE